MTAPESYQAEQALLGAALVDADAAAKVSTLPADCWYHPAHGIIADAISTLDGSGLTVDSLSVLDRLTVTGQIGQCGGPQALIDIAAGVTATNPQAMDQLVQQLRRLAKARKYGEIGREAAHRADSYDIEGAQAAFDQAMDLPEADGLASVQSLVDGHLHLLDERARGLVPGIPTGIPSIDGIITNLRLGGLYTVGARPGMGKTTFCVQLAINLASRGVPVLFCSLEMSLTELLDKFTANLGMIDSRILSKPAAHDMRRAAAALEKLRHLPIDIIDSSEQTVASIRSAARTGGYEVVIVDYLQLVSGKGHNRVEEVSGITRGFKVMARTLKCCVVACSQLNRNLEQRLNKKPMLSDFRESGTIEQDSDVCFGLHREAAYDSAEDPSTMEAIVLKNRHGPIGTAPLAVALEMSRINGGVASTWQDEGRLADIWKTMGEREWQRAKAAGREAPSGWRGQQWKAKVSENYEAQHGERAREVWKAHPHQPLDYYIWALEPGLARRDWSIPLEGSSDPGLAESGEQYPQEHEDAEPDPDAYAEPAQEPTDDPSSVLVPSGA